MCSTWDSRITIGSASLCVLAALALTACGGGRIVTPPPPTLVLPETVEATDEPTPALTFTPRAVSPTQSPSATRTSGPSFSSPPPATLRVDDAEQVSGVGTFCWTAGEGGGICADYMGVPTPAEPLQASSPGRAALELQVASRPDALSLVVYSVSPEMDQLPGNPDTSSWPFPQEYELRQELELETRTQFEFVLEPGLHVVSVFAAWDDLGDVNYGFLLVIQ